MPLCDLSCNAIKITATKFVLQAFLHSDAELSSKSSILNGYSIKIKRTYFDYFDYFTLIDLKE